MNAIDDSTRIVLPHVAQLGYRGGFIMLVDVTQETNLEIQKKRFVRMISHHLRYPTNPLMGYCRDRVNLQRFTVSKRVKSAVVCVDGMWGTLLVTPSTNSTRNGLASPVIRFVVTVFLLAVVAAVLALVAFAGSAEKSDWWWVVAGGLVVAYVQGGFSVARFRRSRSEMLSHDEVLFPVLLLVVGPTGSILAWCLGVFLSNLMARRPPLKTVFNLGVFTLGSGLGAGVAMLLGGASVDPVGILATLAGTVLFAVSMSLIFSGLMARLEGESWRKTALASLAEDYPKITLEILLGMLVAVAVKTAPVVTPLAVALLLALRHAYRRWFRFDRDRRQLQDLLQVAAGIQASTTVDGVESALTEAVYTLTAASSHVIRSVESPQGGLVLPLHLADGKTWSLVVDRDLPLDSHDRSLVETLARIGSIAFATAVLLEERQATAERLETLVRSKEEFLLAVAHEIRTPLTAVNGFASVLSTSPTGDLAGEAAGHILTQSLELTHLVDNLLLAARAESGELNLCPTLIDLRSELRHVVDSLPDEHRPDTTIPNQPCATLADPVRVRQILRNLVLNALYHGGDEVTVAGRRTSLDVYVEVRDNGPGIDEADIESVFAPFEHRHRVPGRPGSLGLGLSVSRLLAERMGGVITYERAGEHTIFVLRLPAAAPNPHRSQPHTPLVLKLIEPESHTGLHP